MKKAFLLVILFILTTSSAFALDVPGAPRDYVHDDAGILASSEVSTLVNKLRNFEAETSNQLFVAIFPSLDGDSLEDFSIRLAEKWKVGQKGKDNGIILLVIPNDRLLRIEVGYGLESVIPDAYASRIIEDALKPAFRAGKFYEGIDHAASLLMEAARGSYDENLKKTSDSGFPFTTIFILLFILYSFLNWVRRISGGATYHRRGWTRGGGFFGGFGGSGGGGFGGGFGGGGGGSFGGGGSSGRW